MAHQAIVRMPQSLAYPPGEVEALLAQAGFPSLETPCDTNDIVYGNTEDWWAFQLTLGARAAILDLDDQARARFREEYLSKLGPLFCPDGLHLSVAVVYALGQQ